MSILHNRREVFRQMLENPEAFATTLLTIVLDAYGTKSLSDPDNDGLPWTHETLRRELYEDFDVKLSSPSLNKLMAAICIKTSNDFFVRPSRFVQLCLALDGHFDPTTFEPAQAVDCAWGITEALLLEPPETDEPFCDEIRHYIGFVLDQEGIRTPPDVLRIALRDEANTADFSGIDLSDPQIFGAEFQLQEDHGQEIEEVVREKLQQLLRQLAALPLENGDSRDVANKARNALGN